MLKRLSRKRVIKRKLPNRFGNQQIFVTPESSLKHWHYNLEKVDPPLIKSAEELVREGNVVWDIGANVGLFTFITGTLTGPNGFILAIEADLYLASLILRSSLIANNKRAKIEILPIGISDKVSISRLMIPEIGRASNYLEESAREEAGIKLVGNQVVMTVTLDWLLEHFPSPNVVKVDVEGNEKRVFQGAQKLLNEVKPIILCEVSCDIQEISSILIDAGYKLFDASMNSGERFPLNAACWNLLAIP